MDKFSNHKRYPTPLEDFSRLGQSLEVDLKIKRDDLFPFPGGGNKARKIGYFTEKAKSVGANALVTAGDLQSNHARVVALAGAKLGWKVMLVIHDAELPVKELTGNYLFSHLSGAEIIHCSLAEAGPTMDKAMQDLREKGYNPFYIWGGGHALEGHIAYRDAVVELKNQLDDTNWWPEYIVVASGTGGTQAGIHFGCTEQDVKAEVLGVSVSRKKERGQKVVEDSIQELCHHYNYDLNSVPPVRFYDDWVGDGYKSSNRDIENTISWAMRTGGLPLDTTYTGKAFYGMTQLLKNGVIPPKSKVLFWHTGGIMNLLSSPLPLDF